MPMMTWHRIMVMIVIMSMMLVRLPSSAIAAASASHTGDHVITLTAYQREWQLRVSLHHELFRDDYMEHTIDIRQPLSSSSYHTVYRTAPSCIYRGRLVDDVHSVAIIDVCGSSSSLSSSHGNGIHGWIRTAADGEYLLQSLSPSQVNPHRQRGYMTQDMNHNNDDIASSSSSTWSTAHLQRSSLITADVTAVPHRLYRLNTPLTVQDMNMQLSSSDTTSHACGLTHSHDEQSGSSLFVSQSRPPSSSSSFETTSVDAPRYVELLLVSDYLRYLNFTSDAQAVAVNSAYAAAIAAELYATGTSTVLSDTPIQVVLTSQYIFTAGDPYTVTTATDGTVDPTPLLTKFNQWRAITANVHGAVHDAGHLLSGYTFTNGVRGLAGLGTMCVNAASGGVESSLGINGIYLGVLIAHELGHNLGMIHDGGGTDQSTCVGTNYLMNTATCINCAVSFYTFSPCDASSLKMFLHGATSTASCLDNVPTTTWSTNATCGNGIVETGEACDCGTDWTCTSDPCCNGVTCQLRTGMQCSALSPCCTSCMFTPASANYVCRTNVSVCDTPEVCDGTSGTCPFDMIVGEGTSCVTPSGTATVSSNGVCHSGTCVSYLSSCQRYGLLFDPAGTNYTACPALEATAINGGNLCGMLLCTKNEVTSGCYGFTVDSLKVQVDDGIACNVVNGEQYQCYNGACVTSQSINQFAWNISSWSACSSSNCGTQSRTISCSGTAIGYTGVVPLSACSAPIPATTQSCTCTEEETTTDGYIALAALGGGILAGLCICGAIYTCNRLRIRRNRRKRAQYATNALATGSGDAVQPIHGRNGHKKKKKKSRKNQNDVGDDIEGTPKSHTRGVNNEDAIAAALHDEPGEEGAKKKKKKKKSKKGSNQFDDMKDGTASVVEMGALAPGSEHVVRSPMMMRGSLAGTPAAAAAAGTEPPAEIRLNVGVSGVASPEQRPMKLFSTTPSGNDEKKSKRKKNIFTPGGNQLSTPSRTPGVAATVASPATPSPIASETPNGTFVLRTELNPSPTARRASLPPLTHDGMPMTLQGGVMTSPQQPKRSDSKSMKKKLGSSKSSKKRSSVTSGSNGSPKSSPKSSPKMVDMARRGSLPSAGTGRRPSITMGKLPAAPTIHVAPSGSGSGAGGQELNDLGDDFALNFSG